MSFQTADTTDMFLADQFNSSRNGSRVELCSRPTTAQSRLAWQRSTDNDDNDFDGKCNLAMELQEKKTDFNRSECETSPAVVVPRVDTNEEQSVTCCKSFKKKIRSLWATRHTEDTSEDRELYIKTTLRELIVYVIFLIVIMLITFGMTSSTMYYYTKVLSELFLDTNFPNSTKDNFRSSSSINDFWTFAENVLMNGLYWDNWYNNANVSEDEKNLIYYENKLLGVPRIRQVKVRQDSCNVASEFKKDIQKCFAEYSKGAEDKKSFGVINSTAWQYSSPEKTGQQDYGGKISTYGGGGYYFELKRDKSASSDIISELKNQLWIRRGTRAVFFDFTVYNANINLFCVIKIVMEFPATGGGIPSWEFRTVKLIRYVEPMDYFILACELVFVLFIFYYIVEECIEIKKHRLSYFKSMWNWLDILVILISIICGIFNIYRTMAVERKIKQLLQQEDTFPDFDFLSYWQQQFNNANGIAVFFAWIKIFKYISFNKTMTQLSLTLGNCAKDLFGFAIMFFIVFFAFAQLGYLFFGSDVRDFREFQHAVFTLFRIILGDFDFEAIESTHRVFGPLYFILYVFFVFFVLLNMFLAIINDTYSEVKSELAQQPNEFEMGDYFKQRAGKVIEKLNFKRDRIMDIQKAIRAADLNNDHKLDFDEWRNELKIRGYADAEIEAVFSKYDLDGDRVLNEHEQNKMYRQLEGEKLENVQQQEKLNDQIEGNMNDPSSSRNNYEDNATSFNQQCNGAHGQPGIALDEFNLVLRRVDQMEQNIGRIVNKIDLVLMKLELMEKAKLKRREMMSKILDGIIESVELSDEAKCDKIERLVQEELELWNKEALIRPTSSRLTTNDNLSSRSSKMSTHSNA